MTRGWQPLVVLREYVVQVVREQVTEVYTVAKDPDQAADQALALLETEDVTWDDVEVVVNNIEEA